eukprot:SAG31_NODE_3316_length_4425_cov_3.196024_5_plen_75_part_00
MIPPQHRRFCRFSFGFVTKLEPNFIHVQVKIGWSWEAKYVWFWQGEENLAACLHAMVDLPGRVSPEQPLYVLNA